MKATTEKMRLSNWLADAFLIVALACLFLLAGCKKPTPPPNPHTAEKTILKMETNWSHFASMRDIDQTLSFYSEDAMVMPPGSPMVNDPRSIRKLWTALLAPDKTLTWKPYSLQAAGGADIVYEIGTYTLVDNSFKGKVVTENGKYLTVWKLEPDQSWKAVVDIWNANGPSKTSAAPTTPKARKRR